MKKVWLVFLGIANLTISSNWARAKKNLVAGTVIRFLVTYLKPFLGALLLDQGVEAVKRFIYQVMIPKVETGQFSQVIDYKTRLQELLQVHGDVEIQYQVVSESGPAHAKEFEVEVFVNGKRWDHGHVVPTKLAEQEAARNAVETRNDGPCI